MPNENLLFNGWGVTPAGEHVRISDMPFKLVVSPDKKMLLAASAGYNDTGLTCWISSRGKVTSFCRCRRFGMAWRSARMAAAFLCRAAIRPSPRVQLRRRQGDARDPVKPAPERRDGVWRAIAVHPDNRQGSMSATKAIMRSGC